MRDGSEIEQGLILVRGRVDSPELSGWRLEFAPGENPSDDDFEILRESESSARGQLTRWDTRALEPGEYVLRLVLEDDFLGEISIEVTIEILKAEEDEEVDGNELADPDPPPAGDAAPPDDGSEDKRGDEAEQ